MPVCGGRRSYQPNDRAENMALYRIALLGSLAFLSFLWTAVVPARGAAPIRIGATVSLSGKYREPSLMLRDGYRLWARQTNAAGGLGGRPVELLLHDDQSRADLAEALYTRLIREDHVDLVLSPYGTPLTLAASAVTERYGYLMLAAAASGETIWQRNFRYVMGMFALPDRDSIGFCDLMARHGYRRLAIVYEDSPFHRDVASGSRHWAARFGLEVVFDRAFQDGQAELPALAEQIRPLAPDGVIVTAYPEDGYLFLEASGPRRPASILLTIAPVHPDFSRRAGKLAEGVFCSSQWEPDERIPFPGTRQFVEDFTAFTGNIPSYHAGVAFAAGQIIERAVRQTGTLNQEILRNYVSALDTVTVIGRFKVDPQGRQVGHNPILIQWQDGKKEIVYPKKMRTAAPRM